MNTVPGPPCDSSIGKHHYKRRVQLHLDAHHATVQMMPLLRHDEILLLPGIQNMAQLNQELMVQSLKGSRYVTALAKVPKNISIGCPWKAETPNWAGWCMMAHLHIYHTPHTFIVLGNAYAIL